MKAATGFLLAIVCASSLSFADERQLPVFGMHDYELRAGITSADFEAFVKGEFAKAWKEKIGGVRAMVMKGNSTAVRGRYRFVYRFDSVERRNKYFPGDRPNGSVAWFAVMKPVRSVMDRFEAMVRRIEFGEFVALHE